MISPRLSLNMPRLNQNQRIQALTILARGDVSNISRAFGCHRNTIIRLRQRFQLTGGVADRRRPGRPRVTNPRTDRFIRFPNGDKFCKAVRYQQTDSVAPPQASPAIHSAKEALCGYNGISVRGDSSGLGFYSLMSLGLTLVIMAVEFEFLEEEGNVLQIIVSLRETDLEVGVLWYGVALWTEGKQISLLCKATSMLKVTLTRFCSLKLFLSFKGIGLQY